MWRPEAPDDLRGPRRNAHSFEHQHSRKEAMGEGDDNPWNVERDFEIAGGSEGRKLSAADSEQQVRSGEVRAKTKEESTFPTST